MAALAAAGRVVASVTKPDGLLLGADDVMALLTSSASLVVESPAEGDERDELRRLAGLVMIPMLHRPPIEALLAPQSSLEALEEIPRGADALRWCAQPDADTGLGTWGAKARQLLKSFLSPEPAFANVSESAEGAYTFGFSARTLDSIDYDKFMSSVPIDKSSVVEAEKLRAEVLDLDYDLASLEAELAAELLAEDLQVPEGDVQVPFEDAGSNAHSAWRAKCIVESIRVDARQETVKATSNRVGGGSRDARGEAHLDREVMTDSSTSMVGAGHCDSSDPLRWEAFSPMELARLCVSRPDDIDGDRAPLINVVAPFSLRIDACELMAMD